jgi:hypothetical protein
MKFYLILLRRNGKRLAADQVVRPARLITMRTGIVKGYRLARATCCTGGGEIASLWEPALLQIREEDLTLQGFECLDHGSMVQEWLLRPHFVPPWNGDRQ